MKALSAGVYLAGLLGLGVFGLGVINGTVSDMLTPHNVGEGVAMGRVLDELLAEKEIEELARDLLISPEVNSVPEAFVLAQEFYRVRDER